MPREAVILGNCVITNLKGSAKNNYDIPIGGKYKFKEEFKNINKIDKIINRIFNNYKKEFLHFRHYKKKVLKEKKIFISQIRKAFLKK